MVVLRASAGIQRPIETIKKAMGDFHWKEDHDFVYADFLSLCRTLHQEDKSEHKDEQDGEHTRIPGHMNADIAALHANLDQRKEKQDVLVVPMQESSSICTLQEVADLRTFIGQVDCCQKQSFVNHHKATYHYSCYVFVIIRVVTPRQLTTIATWWSLLLLLVVYCTWCSNTTTTLTYTTVSFKSVDNI